MASHAISKGECSLLTFNFFNEEDPHKIYDTNNKSMTLTHSFSILLDS